MNESMNVKLACGNQTKVSYLSDLSDLSTMLGNFGNRALWVADSNTANLFKRLPPTNIIISAGEKSKTLSTVEKILRVCVQEGISRDDYIIAFGGGVVCDLAAFAASIYMRGCKVILVPTSLLCMVDATLGGKTGCDFVGGKNLIGSFYPAEQVLICPPLLKSLSEREYLNGLAEVLKHALLSKNEILHKFLISRKSQILLRDENTLLSLLEMSLEVKKSYIEKDPEEKLGIRQALNLGHTFGHALESCGRFSRFSHGESVAWGCVRALEASLLLKIVNENFANQAIKLFRLYNFDIDYKIGRGEWLEFFNTIQKDKKKRDGVVQFVLMKDQGEYVLTGLTKQMIMNLVISNPGYVND
ncbi:MAG: 3-dehydroquinate synthase [Sphaerochaetaceae bacterium]|nr:3-dehydroquinate synthase [Sphaerochaetaceae bacterium]MDC7250151.1 3-dehydroquinate synthase [Sphaerochaetaceae bacterium]